jgi:hypothetical protein
MASSPEWTPDPSSFPRLLPGSYRITSPATPDYNCLAWAVGETNRFWGVSRGRFWPADLPENNEQVLALPTLERAFATYGFVRSADGFLVEGVEKIALYANDAGWTHAARQLADGRWTSKLGRLVDIEHDTPEAVGGGAYGEVILFLQRPAGQA